MLPPIRPLRLLYGLIFLASICLCLVAYHSINAFEQKVYSLREGYLNELIHALSGPLAMLEQQGVKSPEDLNRVFQPFESIESTGLYDIERHRLLLLHLLVTDSDGTVLFDSTHHDVGTNLSVRPEVAAALSGHVHRRDEDEGEGVYRMHVGIPIRSNGSITGALIASKSNVLLKPLVLAVEQGLLFVFLLSGLMGSLILLTAYLFMYRRIELWMGRLDLVRGRGRTLSPTLRRKRFGRLGLLLDRVHETISEKRHMEQMVACLAHEMKNPINAVRTHAELLSRSHEINDRADLIAEIKSCCDRMTNVMERLLVIAAIERRESLDELLPIPIDTVVIGAISRHQDAAKQQGVTLELRGDLQCQVRCEPVLMELALGNLIQNAIDHSPRGRHVLVTLIDQGKSIVFQIRDQGQGIPDHAVGQVFDKYFTLPKVTTGRAGTGIGLNVVQHVADLHYGEITLKNHPEGGVLAVLSIPF